MSFIWKKEYELGIPEIDDQHRLLFRRIDNLSLALYDNKGRDELHSLIKYLREYIEVHFSFEENLFGPTGYPDAVAHGEEHRRFIDYVQSLDHEIKSRGADNFLAIKVEREIRDWWEKHESQYDRKYLPYVTEGR